MPSTLSVDLRERVVAAVAGGASCRRAAERFGVSASSASRWRRRLAQEGSVAPKPRGGDQRSRRLEARADLVLALYEERPDIFLSELRDALAEREVRTSTSGLARFFASLKKEHVHHIHFRTRAEARAAVFEYVEIFYNRQRLHSALGYRTPAEARAAMEGITMRAAA